MAIRILVLLFVCVFSTQASLTPPETSLQPKVSTLHLSPKIRLALKLGTNGTPFKLDTYVSPQAQTIYNAPIKLDTYDVDVAVAELAEQIKSASYGRRVIVHQVYISHLVRLDTKEDYRSVVVVFTYVLSSPRYEN